MTIDSILLHSFLLIYHPYPPSFHEMIFSVTKGRTKSANTGIYTHACAKTLIRMRISAGHAPGLVIAACRKCAELIYVKTTETTCVSDELCRFIKRRRRRATNRDDSRIKRVLERLAIPTVRVEALEYS